MASPNMTAVPNNGPSSPKPEAAAHDHKETLNFTKPPAEPTIYDVIATALQE